MRAETEAKSFGIFFECENIRGVHRGEEEGADPEVKWRAETRGDNDAPPHALQGVAADHCELPRSHRALALVEVIDIAVHTPTPAVRAWRGVVGTFDAADKPREQLAVAHLGIEGGEHHVDRRDGVSNNDPARGGLEYWGSKGCQLAILSSQPSPHLLPGWSQPCS